MSKKTPSSRREACKAVLRLGMGKVLTQHVRSVAEFHEVSERTLYRWLSILDADTESDAPVQNERFEVDVNMLTVVAQEQTRSSAYAKLVKAGIIHVSYATFCRALERMSPALVHGAMSGRKEMASNRVYLKKFVPHRCHTYFLDHTPLDIWVMADHRSTKPVRPHLTLIGDGYSGYLWGFVWYGKPDGSAIAAALASTCIEGSTDGASIGGVPQQLILDNAGEHFGPDMRNACSALGIVVSPTSAYSSWQNGQAERAIGVVNRLVTADAPGATRVGSDPSSDRFLETVRAKTDSTTLWSAGALEQKVRDVLTHVNTGIRRKDRGGLTRLELFDQDPTDRTFLSEEAARLVALRTDKATYRGSKSGIQFRNRHYVSADLSPKHTYKLRHLPGVTEFVEVFDTDDRYLTRAYEQESLPLKERNRLLAERARTEREVRAVEEGVKGHRRHLAALDNANADPSAYDPVDDVPARNPHVDKSPKRKKLARVRVNAPTAKEIEATNRHHEEVMNDPKHKPWLAQIAAANAARDSKSEGSTND